MATPFSLTKDGFEIQFQSNFLGHFAFTLPLLPTLVRTSRTSPDGARIVQISSFGHNFASRIGDVVASTKDLPKDKQRKGLGFQTKEDVNRNFGSTWKRYGQSKICNIFFAREIARRLEGEKVWSNVVHPGNINTGSSFLSNNYSDRSRRC